ncbi:MAG: SGNH/GDSL hydrolase family protein, partial [Chloroflexota bacterium]
FAKNDRAGEVSIHWLDQPPQIVDLQAAEIAISGVTLPIEGAVFWQSEVPIPMVREGIGISVDPDPADGFNTTVQEITLSGIPGQTLSLATQELAQVLQVENGQSLTTEAGVKFQPNGEVDGPLHLSLDEAIVGNSVWLLILPWLENLLIVAHLALIGAFVATVLSKLMPAQALTNLNLALLSIVVALVASELLLRVVVPPPTKYHVWKPGVRRLIEPDSEALPGVSGETNVVINDEGFRGDELTANTGYKIITIGGSTTENFYLDQIETWPHSVQRKLNESESNLQAWVGNAGRSGHTTREHVLQAKHLLPQYPDLDAVILLVGINDLALRLEQGEQYSANYAISPRLMNRAFDVLPQQDTNLLPYYQQSAIWRLVDTIQQAQRRVATVTDVEVLQENGQVFIRRREQRQSAPILDQLPDLSESLVEYQRNINAIIDTAETHNTRLILVTQPTLWQEDLTPEEAALLWFGWGPNRDYFYQVDALIEGLTRYNETLLEICRQRQVECLDLAQQLPQTSKIFYDDVHFTEYGAEQVATIVANYLLQQPPFLDN